MTLAVVGRRSDGYHSLHSVMVPLTLGDALTLSAAPAGATEDALTISGLSLATTPDNLVLRAIVATRAAVESAGAVPSGQADAGPAASGGTPFLAARLVKRIPTAAGLGGGSSDAAAAIDAALAVWNATLTPAQATDVAAELGSDVPFFLARGAALVTGRGEFVEPLPQLEGEPPAVLLVTPQLPISTAAVFATFAGDPEPLPPAGPRPSAVSQPPAGPRPAAAPPPPADSTSLALAVSVGIAAKMRSGLAASGLLEVAADLAGANDLLPATQSIAPDLPEFMAALGDLLGRPVGLSGSGPTLWALYPSLPEAVRAARIVRQGVLEGKLPAIGTGEPFVAATSVAVRPDDPPAADRDAIARPLAQANRPHTVHNGSGDPVRRPSGSAAQPHSPKGDDSR
ncbi:MAG: 4-(cytidine 5'-diphospho)-2-C-methyl-D-erythritol kinase [Candidatus Limnocylindrales bacterium]